MSYLLDTCIISKLRRIKTHPDEQLEDWINSRKESEFYLSVITIGEIQAAINLIPTKKASDKKKKMILEDWLYCQLFERFKNRILDINTAVILKWGKIIGKGKQEGYSIPAMDALIAATGLQHNLIVVTDNIKHLETSGVEYFSPWK